MTGQFHFICNLTATNVYTHISDLWIPFYTQVITCYVRQALYILDGFQGQKAAAGTDDLRLILVELSASMPATAAPVPSSCPPEIDTLVWPVIEIRLVADAPGSAEMLP